MNDIRELLALAAKAAGLTVDRHSECGLYIYTSTLGKWWSPLLLDGDALRLAAELKMNVCLHTTPVHVYADMPNRDVVTDACYRRAITRAAAEIGRGMA